MAIISSESVKKSVYRLTFSCGCGKTENMVVTDDGLYIIFYIKDGNMINRTGKILSVMSNTSLPRNSYLLFDSSESKSNRKERIYFFQVQYIRDITPNDAYRIAVNHGFSGTVEDWLASLNGDPGKSAYESALDCGFTGTEAEWVASLYGKDGKSAYEIAVERGYDGTVDEWLDSLHGEDGKSAYEMAIERGFEGTEEDWMTSMGDVTVVRDEVEVLVNHLEWLDGMASPNLETSSNEG